MERIVREIVKRHRGKDSRLLAILHNIQDEFGYIPLGSIEILADEMGMKAGEIYDTASFYSFFHFDRPATHVIRICNGIVCNLKGSESLIETIREGYGIGDGETTEDGVFRLEIVECIGRCEGPPAMLVDDDAYGNLTPEKVLEILRGYEK